MSMPSKTTFILLLCLLVVFLTVHAVGAADVVPEAIKQPGTQPGEAGNLESPDKCDNCHGGYNQAVEPAFNWRGSMMGNAGRDPIFWATLAIAEQDFDGAGDLCIRCHSAGGWYAGRSEPTDGSGLMASDDNGVDCDTCHKMTNPDDSELLGVMNWPFVANSLGEGFYGSGILSLWGGADKLGPYNDAAARHQFMQSKFHRSVDFCGSCHDVSNPVVGDVAIGNGAQETANPVVASGDLGSVVGSKAAFNNPPYRYGIVERTFSEFKSGLVSKTLVSSYLSLPVELQDGSFKAAYESALVAGTGGNYADNSPRFFSCQTCHLRPVNGPGCNKKDAPVRTDLPLHDMTGGNYWIADAIVYQDLKGTLRLGGGLTDIQRAALSDGQVRAKKQLNQAASLDVSGNTLRINNLTGHKLITGYPEGRRMWLNIKWYDVDNVLLREDGAYGPLFDGNGSPVVVENPDAPGTFVQVESIQDLYDPKTRIYEAHYGMTQEWAGQLVSLGYTTTMPLSYDRYTGEIDYTLGDLAAQAPGTYHETFHFVLNNAVTKDNRIPPYGMNAETARVRNALPVPADQYGVSLGSDGRPLPDSIYNHWDEITLDPPAGATYATIDLLYQSTSWEYIQFLWKANVGKTAFLADEGVNMLDAWLNAASANNTTMAEPYKMVSTTWGSAPVPPTPMMYADSLTTWSLSKQGNLVAETTTFNIRDTVAIKAHVVDENLVPLTGAQVFTEIRDSAGNLTISLQEFTDDTGTAVLRWKTGRREVPDIYIATVVDIIKNGFQFDEGLGQTQVTFTLQ